MTPTAFLRCRRCCSHPRPARGPVARRHPRSTCATSTSTGSRPPKASREQLPEVAGRTRDHVVRRPATGGRRSREPTPSSARPGRRVAGDGGRLRGEDDSADLYPRPSHSIVTGTPSDRRERGQRRTHRRAAGDAHRRSASCVGRRRHTSASRGCTAPPACRRHAALVSTGLVTVAAGFQGRPRLIRHTAMVDANTPASLTVEQIWTCATRWSWRPCAACLTRADLGMMRKAGARRELRSVAPAAHLVGPGLKRRFQPGVVRPAITTSAACPDPAARC